MRSLYSIVIMINFITLHHLAVFGSTRCSLHFYLNHTTFSNMFGVVILPTVTGDNHSPANSPGILGLWLGAALILLTTVMDSSPSPPQHARCILLN